ncbi:hypothetical protein N8482_00425 [Chitinophagales bacterium]|nr:hypothetical protein [Chitinophagales bacterium]
MLSLSLFAQKNSRLTADFTIKEKLIDGAERLTIGQVYFDKPTAQLSYYITFPDTAVIVLRDSLLRTVDRNELSDEIIPNNNRFSVFSLALHSQLNDFGLKDMGFELTNLEQADNAVICTYAPPKVLQEIMGNILLSLEDRILQGVIFLEPDGQVKGKQFFESYATYNGILFPHKMVQLSGGETSTFKVTEFSNLRIDDESKEERYTNFPTSTTALFE